MGLIKPSILIFLFLSNLFLIRYVLVGQAVYGDGIFYYSYTRSLVKDKDLFFANELGHHWSPENNNSLIEDMPDIITQRTSTGMVANKYPVGVPLAWLPVFTLADIAANTLHRFNPNFPNNGYADIYQISLGLFNVALVALGIHLLVKFWGKFFTLKTAWIATAVILLASNLIYYGALDVINSHPLSFLLSVLLLKQFWSIRQTKIQTNNLKSWCWLGTLIGAMTMIRTQHLIFLVLITLDTLINGGLKQIKNLLVMITNATLVFTPQLLTWYLIYGKIASPYLLTSEGFNFLKPHLLAVLLNPQVGLLIWTPIYGLAFFGLLKYLGKNPPLAKIGLVVFLAQLYLISSWSGWTQGESFSARMLINTLPFLTGGLIYLYAKWQKQFGQKRVYWLSIFLISYNLLSIGYFQLIYQSPTFDKGTITQQQRWQNLKQKLME